MASFCHSYIRYAKGIPMKIFRRLFSRRLTKVYHCPFCGCEIITSFRGSAQCPMCGVVFEFPGAKINIRGVKVSEVETLSSKILTQFSNSIKESNPKPEPVIFISYRREDSCAIAGRLFDRLENRFGKGRVFMDIDAIPHGVDFAKYIQTILRQVNVVLAVIGPKWTIQKNGRELKDDPEDYVRLELEAAVSRSLIIIPILIDDTPMPSRMQLPMTLAKLYTLNAAPLSSGVDFNQHVAQIMEDIESLLLQTRPSPPMTFGEQEQGDNGKSTK